MDEVIKKDPIYIHSNPRCFIYNYEQLKLQQKLEEIEKQQKEKLEKEKEKFEKDCKKVVE